MAKVALTQKSWFGLKCFVCVVSSVDLFSELCILFVPYGVDSGFPIGVVLDVELLMEGPGYFVRFVNFMSKIQP